MTAEMSRWIVGTSLNSEAPHVVLDLPDDHASLRKCGAFRDNRIVVRCYEWHDDTGNWFPQLRQRELGVRRARADAAAMASINDLPIKEGERKYHCPLGRVPTAIPA